MGGTYIVTGASRGIGLEFVRQLRARGDSVIAAVRSPESVGGPLRALGAEVLPLDVMDAASIDAFEQRLEGRAVDVLINNAGVSSEARTLASVTMPEIERVMRVNAIAPILVARSALPALRRGSRRAIVNITSILGSIASNTGGSSYAYRASKAALNMLSVSLHHELSPEGFIVLAIHPGWVRTDMGGPNAHLTPEASVSSMLGVVGKLTSADSGRYCNFDGTPLPW